MNKNNDFLTKEFKIKNFTLKGREVTICRQDYESMPYPMRTDVFFDAEMEKLANDISNSLSQYNFDVQSPYYENDKEEAFWKEMEYCAVKMGMTYYDDL